MKRITTIMIALALTISAAVAQKSTLNAELSGVEDGMKVVLSEVDGGRLVPTDTITPDGKGRFRIVRNATVPQFFTLSLTRGQSPMVHVLMLPGEKIKMNLVYMPSVNFIMVSDVKGSENMEVYGQYTHLMADAITDKAKQATMPYGMESLLKANSDKLISAFLVTYFESVFEQYAPLYKQIRDALIGTYPTNDFVLHLDSKLRGAIVAGMEAPDIVMADKDGVLRKLSDLRGKVVLIDFWASWCRPCRMENPNVVKLYNRFKDKGFDIFSVSLDKSRDAWLKAIVDDGLVWPNHVSDLKYWSSAAGKLYGISSIPATVLVDREGNVVARNLRGKELEDKLEQILAQ